MYINKELVYNQSLIAYNEGVVKNVHIFDSYVHTEAQMQAGIVGYNNGIVDHCSNSATISNGDTRNHMGGIVGWNKGIIKNSYNGGTILATAPGVGGITGYNEGKIISCYNKGKIIFDNMANSVGGIVGTNLDTIINCYNKGDIITSLNNACIVDKNYFYGGISGQGYGKIINCYNKGTIGGIPSVTNEYYVAGIMGISGINRTNEPLQLSNVYNLGNITGNQYVGGISGYGYSQNQSTITNIYNINEIYFGRAMPTNYVMENIGIINADGTFPNSTPYADLLTALNAWVNENKATYPELKNWKAGTDGYPVLDM